MIHIIYNYTRDLEIPGSILASFCAIYILYMLGSLQDPYNSTQAIRAIIFIYTSFFCTFLIPKALARESFLKITSIFSVTILSFGIPASLVGDYSIGPISTMIYYASYDVLGFEIHQITSLMANPNPVGKVAFFGVISGLVWRDHERMWTVTTIICFTGLLLSGSRAAILATFAAGFIYVVGKSSVSDKLNDVVIVCTVCSITGALMLMRIIPAPEAVLSIDLNYRVYIWQAAIEAATTKPIFGHGPENVASIVRPFSDGYVGAGVYNSFLRLFITTGVIGGISYMYIYFYSIVKYTPDISREKALIVYAMLVGYAVDELFSGNSIFGISTMSVVASCLVGYVIYDSIHSGDESV